MNSLDGIKLTIIRSLSDTWRVLSGDKIGEGNVFIRNDLIIKLARYISSRFFFFWKLVKIYKYYLVYDILARFI